jgi:predicted AAA+ superfamily ATPase
VGKRQHDELTERRRLQDAGWDVHKRDAVAFNGGSETDAHAVVKLLVAKHLREQGYRIDTEVKKEGVGEIDVVAYGGEGPPFAVEVETSPTREVVDDKLDRYYRGEPFRDVFIIDPTEMPDSVSGAREFVEGEL